MPSTTLNPLPVVCSDCGSPCWVGTARLRRTDSTWHCHLSDVDHHNQTEAECWACGAILAPGTGFVEGGRGWRCNDLPACRIQVSDVLPFLNRLTRDRAATRHWSERGNVAPMACERCGTVCSPGTAHRDYWAGRWEWCCRDATACGARRHRHVDHDHAEAAENHLGP